MPLPSKKFPGGGGTPTFWVSNIAGVSIKGESGSVEMGTRGLALIMAEISAMKVQRTSWERGCDPTCINMESSILLTTPIIRSQAPPMWDAWGGLNSHVQAWLLRYCCTSGSFAVLRNSNSLLAPMKFVPQSERSCLAGPRMAKNLRRALMQLEVSIDSITSMCTARVLMHVKSTAQRLL